MKRVLQKYQLIERSILTTYRKTLWSPFVYAVKKYRLIQEGDKIAVCISGGKDSMILAKCMQELQRHGKFHFDIEYLCMDPGYNELNRKKTIENCELLGLPVNIFKTEIFDTVVNIENNPCYLCARMRRGYLYKNAQKLGCNKIALGHHFDDVIETILMSMLYGGQIQTMMPKLHSTNHEGMELIRPLYYVKEADIIKWCKHNDLDFIQCACRFTEAYTNSHDGVGDSKRQEMKKLIEHFRSVHDPIEMNIFRSMYNVNLNTVIEYTKDGERVNFLDNY